MLERHAGSLIAAIAALGWLLRVAPYLLDEPYAFPTLYDDGVYFSASALMLRGEVPYRDFVFVHPPGLLLALLPASASALLIGPADGFTASRILVTLVGLANALLCGALARRHFGAVAGVAAALFYATYPEAVAVERTPFLEPFLNLGCLLFAWFWLGERPRDRLAGVFAGFAVAIKLVAGGFCLAAVVSRIATAPRRVVVLAVTALLTCAAMVAPFVWMSPGGFFDGVIYFQLERPPDGALTALERLEEIVNKRRPVSPSLALLGALVAIARFRRPRAEAERFFLTAWLLTLAGFLASRSYWNHYNGHLAITEAILAGFAGSWFIDRVTALTRRPRLAWALVPALLLGGLLPLRFVVGAPRPQGTADTAELSRTLAAKLRPDHEVFAFEPGWILGADRLPERLGGALVVDPYGFMLLEALRSPASPRGSAMEAIRGDAAQEAIARVLRAADLVVLGLRGHLQLGEPLQAEVRAGARLPTHPDAPETYWRRQP